MSEAVIVATARSPIGRANKGSLIDLRPDDMAAQIVRALMAKVPQVKGSDVEDLIMGIGQPAGEGGFNIGRMVAILAGLDDVPGVTVNRYCSSSLQTIRMAAHAINAGEGDCFIAAGVETVSRYASGASDMAPNAIFKGPAERTKARAAGGQGTWTPPTGLPDAYIAMGQTAENVVQQEGVTREEMDHFGVRSHNLAVAHQENGFFEREITPLVDALSLSAHKFGGPKGVGILVVREGKHFEPIVLGGGQERDRRSGTHNVGGIVAAAEALRMTDVERTSEVARISALRDQLFAGLLAIEGAHRTIPAENSVPGVVHVCLQGIESESLLYLLDEADVCASAASACASGAMEPSHVLAAMGLTSDLTMGALRLSLGHTTTEADVDRAIEAITDAVNRIRAVQNRRSL